MNIIDREIISINKHIGNIFQNLKEKKKVTPDEKKKKIMSATQSIANGGKERKGKQQPKKRQMAETSPFAQRKYSEVFFRNINNINNNNNNLQSKMKSKKKNKLKVPSLSSLTISNRPTDREPVSQSVRQTNYQKKLFLIINTHWVTRRKGEKNENFH